MSITRDIASETFHADFDLELEMLNDDIDAAIQASAAMRVIRSVGRVPKYMRTVSHGTMIQACFEANDYHASLDALESFGEQVSDSWGRIKFFIGKWKLQIMQLAAGTATLYHTVKALYNRFLKIKAIEDLAGRHYFTGMSHINNNVFIENGVVKRGKWVTIQALKFKQSDLDEAMHVYRENRAPDGFSKTIKRRSTNIIEGRYRRGSLRLMLSFIAAITTVVIINKISQNTPSALIKAMHVQLPDSDVSFIRYQKEVVRVINTNTNFSVKLNDDNDVVSPSTGETIAVDTDPAGLIKAMGDYATTMNRFEAVVSELSRLSMATANTDNIWTKRAVAFVTTICKAVIDECTSHGGPLRTMLQKLDKYMDSFHKEVAQK